MLFKKFLFRPRASNRFTLSVNVAAQSKVTFNLTYQEMLVRCHGVYRNQFNLDIKQVIFREIFKFWKKILKFFRQFPT